MFQPEFLLFEKIEWSPDFGNVYLAKNDHRWVTFISLKTIGLLPRPDFRIHKDVSALRASIHCFEEIQLMRGASPILSCDFNKVYLPYLK